MKLHSNAAHRSKSFCMYVYDAAKDPVTVTDVRRGTDVLLRSFLWLHCSFMKNVHRTPNSYKDIENKIKSLMCVQKMTKMTKFRWTAIIRLLTTF